MLGESIITSAADPTKAGQSVREVGTNPFIREIARSRIQWKRDEYWGYEVPAARGACRRLPRPCSPDTRGLSAIAPRTCSLTKLAAPRAGAPSPPPARAL
jgi:hypothetical protein